MKNQGISLRRHLRGCIWLVVLTGALVAGWPGTSARADGGAPNLAYVTGAGAGGQEVAVIDIAQRKVTASIAVNGSPWGIVLSADNRFAYVTEQTAAQVAIIDANAHQVVATVPTGAAPEGIALDAGTGNLYVANSGTNTVSILNGDQRKVVTTLTVGNHPTGVAIATVGTSIPNYLDPEVYVANSGSDSVTIISTQKRQVVATVPVPGGPVAIVVPSYGSVAYVATQSGSVAVISLAKRTLLGTLMQQSGAQWGQMDYDAITSQVYLPDATSNQVFILAPASVAGNGTANLPQEPARALPIAGGPAAVAITFDGADGFVAQRGSGQVTMLDAPTHHVLATIRVGGTPHAIITGAYPPLLNRQVANIVGFILIGVLLLGGVALVAWVARSTKKGIDDADTFSA